MRSRRALERVRVIATRFGRAEAGVIAVETALAFTMTITMVFGVMELCMMGYTYSILEDAAREGVRYASVHGNDSTTCSGPSSGCADSSGANVVSDVTTFARLFSGSLTGMNVAVTYPDSSSAPPSRVKVAITYTYKPVFNFPGISHVLSVSSTGRILY